MGRPVVVRACNGASCFNALSCAVNIGTLHAYVCYSESKYRLRISLAYPRDCPFARVQ